MPRGVGSRALVLLPVLLASACISHVRHPYTPAAQPPEPAPPGPFTGERASVEMRLQSGLRARRGDYYVEHFSFDASAPNGQRDNQVYGRLFSGTAPAPRPAIIVLPVWGISEYPSRKMARDLMRRGDGRYDIMLVESDGYLIDWAGLAGAQTEAQFLVLADEAAERVRTAVIDTRRAVDWLAAREQTDPARIGIVGFSLSAVAASLALLHEPRFAAAVLVMPGSNPAEIFAVCAGRPGSVRETIRARFGWSHERYYEVFRKALAYGDARAYAGRIADPGRILFIEAEDDDCMTQASRDGLWQALGRPERISFAFRHRPAFYAMTPLGFNILGRYATGFLRQQLLGAARAGAKAQPARRAQGD